MKLTLDDLAEKCEKCDGTGQEKKVAQNAGGGGIGRQVIATDSTSRSCEDCSGSGRTKLTETGRAIRDLLKVLEKNSFLRVS